MPRETDTSAHCRAAWPWFFTSANSSLVKSGRAVDHERAELVPGARCGHELRQRGPVERGELTIHCRSGADGAGQTGPRSSGSTPQDESDGPAEDGSPRASRR